MAVIHETTLSPGKLELLAAWLPAQQWYTKNAGAPELSRAGGFRLDDPDGEVGMEFMVVTDTSGGRPVSYHVPLSYRGAPLDGAADGLVGTTEHGVLGRRWVYDGAHDPVLAGELLALLQGRAEPQHQTRSDTRETSVTSHYTGEAALTLVSLAKVANTPDGTDIHVETDPHGPLTIKLTRALPPSGATPADALGRVEAAWSPPGGDQARGTFAVLAPAAR
ncbi:maltokinase N-terminal cap-like domain-containing protein [Actinomadura decatromicini]|uniref:1,4-alpha-glucan branching protein n=1 Tax=Actinomadura decatromicini TaxID=2604572 RepID=A0A5D3F2M9_9ACTN|nr:1,4-alpha-glucan branching protein [Actinomadura decatromicini]TYK43257.1 1,4-alpha-glucan branching protein [Actinomadura decatromicini]